MSKIIKVMVSNNINRESVMVSSDETLRNVLEANGVDYTRGMTSLDGATLKAGDLDKTFDDFGIEEKCYLMNVVKADNAASITVAGAACVIASQYTPDELKKVAKYRKNALNLVEGEGRDKEVVFMVAFGNGAGSINSNGAVFGSNTTAAGKAAITIMLPEGLATDKVEEWVMGKVSTSILMLNKVEAQIPAAMAEIEGELAAIKETISVL